ncbi:MAG: ArnT family glycosyltransferase [bacterium]
MIAVLPRLFRIFYPYAWFEDAAYLYHAFAFKSGLRPFVDTICVHPPTIEYLLAGLYNLFGISYRVAEIFTAIIIAFSAVLIFDITRRIFNNYIALFAVIIFSLATLFFRYHIFEREIFTLTISIVIMWMFVQMNFNSTWAFFIGALAGLAMGIKFSGLFILPAIIVTLLVQRDYKKIIFVILGFTLVSLLIWGYFFLRYKEPAYYQLLLFHFFKKSGISVVVKFLDTFVRDLNFLWLLGASGLILSLKIPNKYLLFPFTIFIEITIFFLFISPTLWPHNMIDLLLPLTLGNCISIYYLYKFFTGGSKYSKFAIFTGLFILVFIFCGALNPAHFQGLGFVPRKEFDATVQFIRNHTPDNLPIHAPHYLANEAQRLKIVDYEELIGPYLLMVSKLKSKAKLFENNILYNEWYELVENTLHFWRYELNKDIAEKKISCAVWDNISPEWSLMYNVDTLLEKKISLFTNAGYRIAYKSSHYIVWLVQK